MRTLALDIDALATDGAPFDLALVKQDLRIGDDFDALLVGQWIPDAIVWFEGQTQRSLQARVHRWIIDEFPDCDDQALELPRGKVQSVTSVAYSNGGVITTLRGPSSGSPAGDDYQEDLRGARGRLMPLRGASWPSVDADVPAPIVITYVAGWTATQVPADVKRGLVARIYDSVEIPGADAFNATARDVEFADKLISGYRIVA